MNKEQEKITEVEGLPKDKKEYVMKLLKKSPLELSLEELKEYLDNIIQLKIDVSQQSLTKDVFLHIQFYFRLLDLQTNIIVGQANANGHYIRAICQFLKDKHPDAYRDIFATVDRLSKAYDMQTLKNLPIDLQEHIMNKANNSIKKRGE